MEINRSRDVIVLYKDMAFPVEIDPAMVAAGWAGGQGVTWTDSDDDEFQVTFSDGTYGGFMLVGSNESADQLIAYTGNQPKYQFGVLCAGTWLISTVSFEQYTLESRTLGPLVENTWTVGSRVRLSLRGLFTPQDEWTIAGDPRAPNEFYVGSIVQPPRPNNNNYVMIQTAM